MLLCLWFMLWQIAYSQSVGSWISLWWVKYLPNIQYSITVKPLLQCKRHRIKQSPSIKRSVVENCPENYRYIGTSPLTYCVYWYCSCLSVIWCFLNQLTVHVHVSFFLGKTTSHKIPHLPLKLQFSTYSFFKQCFSLLHYPLIITLYQSQERVYYLNKWWILQVHLIHRTLKIASYMYIYSWHL